MFIEILHGSIDRMLVPCGEILSRMFGIAGQKSFRSSHVSFLDTDFSPDASSEDRNFVKVDDLIHSFSKLSDSNGHGSFIETSEYISRVSTMFRLGSSDRSTSNPIIMSDHFKAVRVFYYLCPISFVLGGVLLAAGIRSSKKEKHPSGVLNVWGGVFIIIGVLSLFFACYGNDIPITERTRRWSIELDNLTIVTNPVFNGLFFTYIGLLVIYILPRVLTCMIRLNWARKARQERQAMPEVERMNEDLAEIERLNKVARMNEPPSPSSTRNPYHHRHGHVNAYEGDIPIGQMDSSGSQLNCKLFRDIKPLSIFCTWANRLWITMITTWFLFLLLMFFWPDSYGEALKSPTDDKFLRAKDSSDPHYSPFRKWFYNNLMGGYSKSIEQNAKLVDQCRMFFLQMYVLIYVSLLFNHFCNIPRAWLLPADTIEKTDKVLCFQKVDPKIERDTLELQYPEAWKRCLVRLSRKIMVPAPVYSDLKTMDFDGTMKRTFVHLGIRYIYEADPVILQRYDKDGELCEPGILVPQFVRRKQSVSTGIEENTLLKKCRQGVEGLRTNYQEQTEQQNLVDQRNGENTIPIDGVELSRKKFGRNIIEVPKQTYWSCLGAMFTGSISVIFGIMGYVFPFFNKQVEPAIFLSIVFLYAMFRGAGAKYVAYKQLKKLVENDELPVRCYRKNNTDVGCHLEDVYRKDIVVGDLVEITEGMEVFGDLVLVQGHCLMDEASLTGETVPCEKESINLEIVNSEKESDLQNYLQNLVVTNQNRLADGTKVFSADVNKASEGKDLAVVGVNRASGFAIRESTLMQDPVTIVDPAAMVRDASDSSLPASVSPLLGQNKTDVNTSLASIKGSTLLNKGSTLLSDTCCCGIVVRIGIDTGRGDALQQLCCGSGIEMYYEWTDLLPVVFGITFLFLYPAIFYFTLFCGGYSAFIISFCFMLQVPIQLVNPLLITGWQNIATSVCNRLRSEHSLTVLDSFKINFAAKVEVFCFDKTGTLTEEDMQMEGVLVCDGTRNKATGQNSTFVSFETVDQLNRDLMGGKRSGYLNGSSSSEVENHSHGVSPNDGHGGVSKVRYGISATSTTQIETTINTTNSPNNIDNVETSARDNSARDIARYSAAQHEVPSSTGSGPTGSGHLSGLLNSSGPRVNDLTMSMGSIMDRPSLAPIFEGTGAMHSDIGPGANLMLTAMVSCNTLSILDLKGNGIEKIYGHPVEVTMLESSGWSLRKDGQQYIASPPERILAELTNGNGNGLQPTKSTGTTVPPLNHDLSHGIRIIRRWKFDHKRQCQTVLVKIPPSSITNGNQTDNVGVSASSNLLGKPATTPVTSTRVTSGSGNARQPPEPPTSELKVLVKGSVESIVGICKKGNAYASDPSLQESVSTILERAKQFSFAGWYVLAVACRDGNDLDETVREQAYNQPEMLQRELLEDVLAGATESDRLSVTGEADAKAATTSTAGKAKGRQEGFFPVGLLVLSNQIKEVTPMMLNELHEANINTVMITGDSVYSGTAVALDCGITKGYEKRKPPEVPSEIPLDAETTQPGIGIPGGLPGGGGDTQLLAAHPSITVSPSIASGTATGGRSGAGNQLVDAQVGFIGDLSQVSRAASKTGAAFDSGASPFHSGASQFHSGASQFLSGDFPAQASDSMGSFPKSSGKGIYTTKSKCGLIPSAESDRHSLKSLKSARSLTHTRSVSRHSHSHAGVSGRQSGFVQALALRGVSIASVRSDRRSHMSHTTHTSRMTIPHHHHDHSASGMAVPHNGSYPSVPHNGTNRRQGSVNDEEGKTEGRHTQNSDPRTSLEIHSPGQSFGLDSSGKRPSAAEAEPGDGNLDRNDESQALLGKDADGVSVGNRIGSITGGNTNTNAAWISNVAPTASVDSNPKISTMTDPDAGYYGQEDETLPSFIVGPAAVGTIAKSDSNLPIKSSGHHVIINTTNIDAQAPNQNGSPGEAFDGSPSGGSNGDPNANALAKGDHEEDDGSRLMSVNVYVLDLDENKEVQCELFKSSEDERFFDHSLTFQKLRNRRVREELLKTGNYEFSISGACFDHMLADKPLDEDSDHELKQQDSSRKPFWNKWKRTSNRSKTTKEGSNNSEAREMARTPAEARALAKAERRTQGIQASDPSVETTSNEPLYITLKSIFPHIRIFGRFKPAGKKRVVEMMKRETGRIIAYVGDGANDSQAADAAHVGCALIDSHGETGEDDLDDDNETNSREDDPKNDFAQRNGSNQTDGGTSRPSNRPSNKKSSRNKMDPTEKSSSVCLAAPFMSTNRDIYSMIHLLKAGRLSLDQSLSLFRYYQSTGLLAWFGSKYHLTSRNTLTSNNQMICKLQDQSVPFTMALTRPNDTLGARNPNSDLLSLPQLMASLINIFWCIGIYIVWYKIIENQVYYLRNDSVKTGWVEPGMVAAGQFSYETGLWFFAFQAITFISQHISACIGRSFRAPVYSNFYISLFAIPLFFVVITLPCMMNNSWINNVTRINFDELGFQIWAEKGPNVIFQWGGTQGAAPRMYMTSIVDLNPPTPLDNSAPRFKWYSGDQVFTATKTGVGGAINTDVGGGDSGLLKLDDQFASEVLKTPLEQACMRQNYIGVTKDDDGIADENGIVNDTDADGVETLQNGPFTGGKCLPFLGLDHAKGKSSLNVRKVDEYFKLQKHVNYFREIDRFSNAQIAARAAGLAAIASATAASSSTVASDGTPISTASSAIDDSTISVDEKLTTPVTPKASSLLEFENSIFMEVKEQAATDSITPLATEAGDASPAAEGGSTSTTPAGGATLIPPITEDECTQMCLDTWDRDLWTKGNSDASPGPPYGVVPSSTPSDGALSFPRGLRPGMSFNAIHQKLHPGKGKGFYFREERTITRKNSTDGSVKTYVFLPYPQLYLVEASNHHTLDSGVPPEEGNGNGLIHNDLVQISWEDTSKPKEAAKKTDGSGEPDLYTTGPLTGKPKKLVYPRISVDLTQQEYEGTKGSSDTADKSEKDTPEESKGAKDDPESNAQADYGLFGKNGNNMFAAEYVYHFACRYSFYQSDSRKCYHFPVEPILIGSGKVEPAYGGISSAILAANPNATYKLTETKHESRWLPALTGSIYAAWAIGMALLVVLTIYVYP